MPFMTMVHDEDPKEKLLKSLKSLGEIDVFNNQVLVAVYIRPQKTKSGIYLSDKTTDEDRYQSKVGVIAKLGPTAFDDPTGVWFKDANMKVGDWVFYRASDGWSITIDNILCRVMDDTAIRGRIPHPDTVW